MNLKFPIALHRVSRFQLSFTQYRQNALNKFMLQAPDMILRICRLVLRTVCFPVDDVTFDIINMPGSLSALAVSVYECED